MKTRVGVLVSGGGSNLQSIIDGCESGKVPAEVVVVISNKEDAFGLVRAKKHNIPAVFLSHRGRSRKEHDDEVSKVLDEHNVDLVCLAGYMRLCGPEFVKKYRSRLINIHPALLPSFPGIHGQRDAIEYGVKVSGCTVHFVDEETDHGPVIIQAAVPVLEDDDEKSLAKRIIKEEHRIYPEAVRLFAEGKLKIDGRRVRISE